MVGNYQASQMLSAQAAQAHHHSAIQTGYLVTALAYETALSTYHKHHVCFELADGWQTHVRETYKAHNSSII